MNKKSKKKNPFSQGSPRNLLFIAFLFVVGLTVLTKLTEYTHQIHEVIYSEFEKKVEEGQVKKVTIAEQDVSGIFKDGSQFQTTIPHNVQIWDLLKKYKVDVAVASSSGKISFWYLIPFLSFIVLLLAAAWFFLFQSRSSNGGSGSNIFSMGKSRARMFMPSTIKENFNSVAGVTEAKEELKDIIDYLKNPDKYRRLGAKITRGVLLVGEPGNGKTLLAKAVAGEANCPFFSISGSDFIEVFVGVGASRVRDLFSKAREYAPSIIFIDEIDAVGRQRGSVAGGSGSHDEREQTLNQLLAEMDGFESSDNSVIVIAATNRADVLDKALLRPGRFDRRVEVPFPDLMSREQILRVHAKGVKIDPSVNLKKIAQGTPGFSGADLANLINEAALHATKAGHETVAVQDFEEARDKIMLGKESKTMVLSPEERKVTAFHEAGHALVRLLLPQDSDPLHKVTIIPRGSALGVTHWLPERERYTESKSRMLASIQSALGGRAAEELVFNVKETGAHSDFVSATKIARQMVCLFGMSDNLGPVIYKQQYGEYQYSEKTAERIDAEVQAILEDCLKKAVQLLTEHRDKLDALAHALLEKETLYAGEIYTLLGMEPRQEHSFS
jgi:cell division protease FtsH